MQISVALASKFNAQVSHETHNQLQYLAVANYADRCGLANIAKHFEAQAEDERGHANKFIDYLNQANAVLAVPAIDPPVSDFSDLMMAAVLARELERKTTMEINSLWDEAVRDLDYSAQVLLQDFSFEQVKEETEAERFIALIDAAGGNGALVDLSFKD
jgi:bacterioferritin B